MFEKRMFSLRTDWELQPNQVMSAFQAIQKTGETVIDLTESNPTRCGFNYPQQIVELLRQAQNLEYNPSPFGRLEAREAVAEYYRAKGRNVTPEQVFLTSSTSEGYSFLFRLLADPGQHILFPRPSYPLFQFLGGLNDVELDYYSLTYQDGWRVDFRNLEKSIHSNTKALVLVNPNNPTGSFIKPEELERLNELCQKHNLTLICDEVFLDFVLNDKSAAVSLADNRDVLTVVLGGLSKCMALPQMKLSWLVVSGPESLVDSAQERLEVIADTYLSVNTPAQNALKGWFEYMPDVQRQVLVRLQGNYQALNDAFAKVSGCAVLKTEGGWYATVRLPDTHKEEDWILTLLQNDRIFVHPGYFFDFTEEPVVVLSLLPEEKVFREGVGRLVNRIQNPSKIGVDQTT